MFPSDLKKLFLNSSSELLTLVSRRNRDRFGPAAHVSLDRLLFYVRVTRIENIPLRILLDSRQLWISVDTMES
ncbi:hypothetical protein QVD17_15342 [Tagetes erecta]|uniref:Uncharacterized protein n=1 Tax=Tagetes erecta TaxID=13708 RepID=A0AAD8KP17_TARER|nr:hypothetical protein QVD17_15342 [Tagetes erecta]